MTTTGMDEFIKLRYIPLYSSSVPVQVWPLLVAKGWHVEPTKRKPDSFFFFPPGVTKKDGKMREDYFDSKRQVIDAIQNSKDYKADLKEIASLRLKMWEEEALGARYTVHFEMGGTVSLSPVEVRFIFLLYLK